MSHVNGDASPHMPPNERSAYEYSMGCDFQALRSPNIGLLAQMLRDHPDYVGFCDKIDRFSSVGRERLGSEEFWDPLAKKIIVGIKVCITGNQKQLSKMKKT